ncbi:MAG: RNA methyltransferase [Ignavibacteriae bacterium]|nr:RNA methyltransferase [Ignavibacteria bacterium]MBI3365338.1 RNA methyltransferase [Ignavibacteriota bacterium]
MTERRREKFLSVIRQRQPTLTLVMEDIHDPHNVSAVLRSADAVGVLEVQLVYANDPFPKLGKKSSASAVKWIHRRKFKSMQECCDRLHEEGFTIYATHIGRRSTSIYDIDLAKKVALVFGNEHRGVSKEASELADALIQIPMAGMIQSLNVSVACAVTLYEAFRQRQAAGMYGKPALAPKEIQTLFDEWTKK